MKGMLKFGLITIAALSVSACDSLDFTSNKGVFHYSNPTASNMVFKIDGKSYDVLPSQKDSIKLSPGEHKLENSKGNVFSFMVFDNNNGGIINPDNHVYYTLSEAYAVEGKGKSFKPATYEVTINGHQLEMAARSANASVIDANMFKCSYPLGEPFPDSIKISDKTSNGNIKSKCFDKPELIQYIETEYGEKLTANASGDQNKDSVNMVFNYDIPTTDGLDPKLQAQAEKMVDVLKELKKTSDTSIHDELSKKYTQLSIELVTLSTSDRSTHSVEQNKKYNDFVRQAGDFISYGVVAK
ncbi:hypothetical protein [Pectobacterium polaris]|uniref:hypothetical protein n=1 Tax=Pectobacterium polaris TaxID=2042057 RepID=UPI002B251F77|nr:hypothetical protein [Pectobacterium polaris]